MDLQLSWLEHLTHNQVVPGSSPGGSTLLNPARAGFFTSILMIACYILFSPAKKLFYTGFVLDSFEERLKKHNEGFYEKSFTSFTNDWELFLLIECDTNHQAISIEKHIKKMKSKIYIQNLKKYPEMISKLKEKFSN